MKAVRFCMLTTFYPPYSFGGDAVGVQRLARGLVRRGHHVTVVHDVDAYNALHRGPEPAQLERDSGVDVVALRSGLGILSPLLTQQTGRPVANGRRLRRLLSPGAFDVVHFHNVSLIGGPGLFRLAGDAVTLYTAHEHWLICPTHVLWRHRRELCTGRQCLRCTLHYRRPPQFWRYTGFLEREIDRVDTVVAVSEFSRQKHREFGLSREMDVLPFFLPDSDTQPAATASPHQRPYFLFAGRLERIKGLDEVIAAFRRFREADLVIAGDGDHAAALRAMADGAANIRFIGLVPPHELPAYYRHAIATVVPSICYETFGNVVIEAFGQGVPVLARRLGALPELVTAAQGGELFDTFEELLTALRRLATDPAYRNRLGAAAREAYLHRWTESAVIPKYLALVRRTAERRGKQRLADALSETPHEGLSTRSV